MVVGEASISNIMGGIENTGGVRLHNHKRKLKQRFDIIKKLGQGTYGKVQLGINKETGQEVAIKTIKKSKIETEADLVRIRREIQIMSSVQHPNIIHIYEVFENREKMVLVMEYAAGGELYDYLSERKVLSEEEARRIFRQIATACYYCHKHKICHRDLKLENILLDENGNAKIADFGLSNVFDDTRLLSTFCGSPLYASPEIVKGTPYHGPEVDCWSLGVLLYTLVYGAMPFDGSNFKRLVKQISQGDYFEPMKPSPASPLIREMLTVNPKTRSDIEKICSHWWVNEGYDESCLDISEYLANQTPVRLDLLLSLAPPPPQLESDKLVVTGEIPEEPVKPELGVPVRSQSVGSLMELSHPAEKRIKDLLLDEVKVSPKRKLENAVSSDHANISSRKDKIIKENTIADISVHGTIMENASQEDASMTEPIPLDKSLTQTLSREMDVEQMEETIDPSLQGAACVEILEDSKKNELKKPSKVKKAVSTTLSTKILEEINENPSQENLSTDVDKENVSKENVNIQEKKKEDDKKEEEEAKIEDSKLDVKKKPVKKGVLTYRNENAVNDNNNAVKAEVLPANVNVNNKPEETTEAVENSNCVESKPLERRRSRIYEQAEKFQNLIAANESKQSDKPKKVILPGVSVDGYKERFERRASTTSTSPSKLKGNIPKRISIDKQASTEQPSEKVEEEKQVESAVQSREAPQQNLKSEAEENKKLKDSISNINDEERKKQLKNAVSIISSVLDKEGTRKSKSRPCIRKPPVPFGASGRSASGSIGMITSPTIPTSEEKQQLKLQVGLEPVEMKLATVQVSTPEQIKYEQPALDSDNKTSSAEITLKSATLPRRKTTKAEIKLNYPQPKPATMEFKTEMAHHIEAPPKLETQRSEAVFPVSAAPNIALRSASLEPESKVKQSPKERIIPISFEKSDEKSEPLSPPPQKPPTPKVSQSQKSLQSQRASSLSRQSTQESDSETTTPSTTGEPIRKSPREYIIPIAVEGGGYVTPRAGSLEPSDTASTASTMTSSSRRANKFNRARRMNSLLSDREGSEDESPFSLHRHSSFGKDSDNEDSRRDTFHMHRLRSSRPMKASLEHTDSLSSGEDDDDDGFEILTAENLFSTLLSRVRDLTQRINVEDGARPGFPSSSRLLNHFNHDTAFWNLRNRMDPFTSRTSPSPLGRPFGRDRSAGSNSAGQLGTPWRRSVSRDLASDIESVFKNSSTPTQTATLPRGDRKTKKDDLNLSDLNLKQLKLSEEDAIALSYLTPGLSRRIQKQLLAQLPPSEAKKLTRTMSMRNSTEKSVTDDGKSANHEYRSIDTTATLPRRYSVESSPSKHGHFSNKDGETENELKSNVITEECNYPRYCDQHINNEEEECYTTPKKSRAMRSMSLREHRSNYLNPRTSSFSRSNSNSLSENTSIKNDDSLTPYKNDAIADYNPKPYSPDYSLSIPRPSPFSYSSSYSPDSSTLGKYLTPNKYVGEAPRSFSPTYADPEKKTEIKKPTVSNRRISRFLRPDFYEKPKEENVLLKEKKEREMETQKVLKEIRDKRKGRLNLRRERSASRDEPGSVSDTAVIKYNTLRNKNTNESEQRNKHESFPKELEPQNASSNKMEDTDNLLNNVSATIKNIESNVKLGDYVNVAGIPEEKPVTKKERMSKLIRPKSYPAENSLKKEPSVPKDEKPEKEAKSKISRLKKGFTQNSKVKDSPPKEQSISEKAPNKNRFLHSIEKKFEKLRSFSSSPNSTEEKKNKEEKKSSVENAIKQLREQSLPRNLDHCITESCLIKRAVSVEDLATLGALGTTNRELQPSRKSVTKILGLFKKYEEKDKKSDKVSKLKKPKEMKPKNVDVVKKDDPQIKTKNTDAAVAKNINKNDNATKSLSQKSKIPGANDLNNKSNPENPQPTQKKLERPRSLLYDHVKQYQNHHGSAVKNDNATSDTSTVCKTSKLPLNGFRRSLNLDNSQIPEPPKFYKQPSRNNINEVQNLCNNLKYENNNNPISLKLNGTDINENNEIKKPDRRNLKLDLSKVSSPQTNIDPTPSTSASETQDYSKDNRNSLTTTDDSSVFLSPCDDNMSCDSWSVCSDFHTQDLLSPISPNGHVYSGDEGESVIDRIRRKSFYTRFNEKKRPRKSSLSGNYRDLDYSQRKGGSYRLPGDYGSLDRRSCDYRSSADRKLGYSSIPDSAKKDYTSYGRSSSLLNDYVNLPNRYQTFNPRMGRHISSLYSPDIEDSSTVDDNISTGKSRKNSYRYQPSSLHNRSSSVSPFNDKSYGDTSSLNQNSMNPANAQTST